MTNVITSQLVKSIADKMGLVQAEAKFAVEYLQYYYEPNKKKKLTKADVTKHTKSFQKMYGLTTNGKLDGRTRTAMRVPRCGCPDFMMLTARNAQANKWGPKKLTYFIEKYVNGISRSDQDDILNLAFEQWEEHADIEIRRVTSRNQANMLLSTGQGRRDNFDGPSGTLAWAYLPPNSNYNGQLQMRFDLDETWTVNARDRGILLLNVACHEFGHLLGLGHSRVQRALMAPYYTAAITKPVHNDDVTRIQKLYGVATPTPPSPPPPPPPGPGTPPPPPPPGGKHTVTINGIDNLGQVLVDGKPVDPFSLI